MAVYATNHKQHKIREYLTGLVWDGIPRIDTLLTDYFGAEDSTYTRDAMRKTLAAAVARAMVPGIRFDCSADTVRRPRRREKHVLPIPGQGTGTQTAWQPLEGKDAAELIQDTGL